MAAVMHQVFISYASQDASAAEQVCRALEGAAIQCWMAPRDVTAGQPYASAIVEAINQCQVMVLLLTANAVDSPHVLREVERASSKKRSVLSLRLDQAELPREFEYFLSANHWLDGSGGPIPRILPALIDAVRARLAAKVPTPAAPGVAKPTPTAAKVNRRILAVGAILAVGLSALAIDRIWLRHSAVPAGTASAPLSSGNDKSIAVLPFADMSEKHDQEYFSDGMTEEIIDLLVKVPDLKVPARTSSFYFKGKSTQIKEIAQQLGVANVLEGSVRKSGNHLRVTAQLIHADSGFHVWSETYDRQLDDIFKTQDEIAAAVVGALKATLIRPGAATPGPTGSIEAHELFLQARAAINRGSERDLVEAYRLLHRAVDIDPKFALAWAELGELAAKDNLDWEIVFSSEGAAHRADNLSGFEAAWGKAREESRRAADEAVRLAPDLAAALLAHASVLALDHDWLGSERERQRALELEPGSAAVNASNADIELGLGKFDESLRLSRRAVELDPLGHGWDQVGFAQFAAGRLEEAAQAFRRATELYPDAVMAHFRLASVYMAQGKVEAARAEFQRDSLLGARILGDVLALDALGHHQEATERMKRVEAQWGDGLAYQISYFYAARRDSDKVFAWLDRAYRQHDGGLADIKSDPRFNRVHTDPRYTQLLHRLNLPTD